MRWICILCVRFYQKYLSALTIGACRYYPSCSQYALWLLYFDNPFFAICKTLLRILRCNQLFAGGIAYPRARVHFGHVVFKYQRVKYWFVPTENAHFCDIMGNFDKNTQVYIIKSLF